MVEANTVDVSGRGPKLYAGDIAFASDRMRPRAEGTRDEASNRGRESHEVL